MRWIRQEVGHGQAVLLLAAKVNETEGFLLLDTGATATVLNKRAIGSYQTGITKVAVGDGTLTMCGEVAVKIDIPGLWYCEKWWSVVMPLLPHENLLEEQGIALLGFLGNDALEQMDAVLNFRTKEIFSRKK